MISRFENYSESGFDYIQTKFISFLVDFLINYKKIY